MARRIPECRWVVLAVVGLMACAPEPRWLAVAGTSAVDVLSPDGHGAAFSRISTATFGPGERVADVAFGPGGASLYVGTSRGTGSELTWIQRSSGARLGSLSMPGDSLTLIRLLPDARSLAVVAMSSGGPDEPDAALHFIPTDLAAAGVRIPLCNAAPAGLATSAVRDRVYALCQSDEVVEVDQKLGVRVRSVYLPSGRGSPTCDAADIHTSANGSVVFVLCAGSGTLLYLDRVQLTPYDSLSVGSGGRRLARTPNGQYVAITRPLDNELVVVDVRRRTVARRIPLESPSDVGIGIDGRSAFVTSTTASHSQLYRVALSTGDVVSQQRVPLHAHRVTIWPGPKSPKMRWRH